ncbi:MAG: carbohydrate ABC transporter permease [Verrucomicrobia bacterium]|nr:carbohydrate ABC transporter permease [Verrucomicrobiota bacterium]MBV9672468.1 carbohydrate ABC transporter permease [Verrucomicrobiota bacterium]
MRNFVLGVCIHLLYLSIGFLFLLPLWWALASSLRPIDDIFRYVSPFSWKAFIPDRLTLQAYYEIFFSKGFGLAVFNSLLVSFSTVVLGLLINSLSGFAFGVLRFPGRNLLFVITVLTFLVPFEAISIPLYTVVRALGWLDTYWALIIPGVANGIVIFLFRQFFSQVPRELVDVARIDGAGWLSIYFRIYLPLSKPVLVSAALLIFLFQWESFLWPLIAVRSENLKVIQVALAGFEQRYQTLWNELFAASVFAALIPLLVLLPLQRYYVQGVTASGFKG